MKNTVLYIMGTVLICCALAAGYYSFQMSSEFVQTNLSGSKTWLILAILAITVELLIFPIITQMLRVKQVMALLTIPVLIVLGIGALGVSIYLEGGKATQVLSDARASREIDSVLAQGHKDSLKKLLATQQKYIDTKRVSKARVTELNNKIKEQASWAKNTAISGINPIIEVVSRVTGWTDKAVQFVFLGLIVGLPTLIRMVLMHCGLLLLFTPYREPKGEGTIFTQEAQPTPAIVQHHEDVVQEPEHLDNTYVEHGAPTQRLGASLGYDEGKVVLFPNQKPDRKKKKKGSSYQDNQELVTEFLEGCGTQQFKPREGWDLFKEQYPHTMRENQFYAAMKALANRDVVRRKKVAGATVYEVAA